MKTEDAIIYAAGAYGAYKLATMKGNPLSLLLVTYAIVIVLAAVINLTIGLGQPSRYEILKQGWELCDSRGIVRTSPQCTKMTYDYYFPDNKKLAEFSFDFAAYYVLFFPVAMIDWYQMNFISSEFEQPEWYYDYYYERSQCTGRSCTEDTVVVKYPRSVEKPHVTAARKAAGYVWIVVFIISILFYIAASNRKMI